MTFAEPLAAGLVLCFIMCAVMVGMSRFRPTLAPRRTRRSRSGESGNLFFTLFGAVALVGVVGATSMSVMQGPVRGMSEVTRRTVAENNMIAGGRLGILSSTTIQASDGDCDADGYIEPLPWRDAGASPKPAGGGLIPLEIAVGKQDPWGNDYGYCVWDHGAVTVSDNNPGCGGSGADRLEGGNLDTQYALALISSGPDRVFQTTCNDWVDANANNEPDVPLIDRPTTSDDLVLGHTYAEASSLGGGLWQLKSGAPSVAEIDKDLEVAGGLEMSGALNLLSQGLILPGDPGDDSVTGACSAANAEQLRRNTSVDPSFLEICDFDGSGNWEPVGGGDNLGDHIATENIQLDTFWLSGDGDNEGLQVSSTGVVSGAGFSIDPTVAAGVFDSGDDTPYSRVSADSFRTNAIGHGQIYMEGSAIDANGPVLIGVGNAGGMTAQDVRLGDANELYVDTSADSVGIGTQTPTQAKLQISKASTYNAENTSGLYIMGGASDTALLMGADAANDVAYIHGMQSGTGWATRPLSLQPNGGSVGIGTIAPAQSLHTTGNVRSDGLYYYFGASQFLQANGTSTVYLNSNHNTMTQLILRDLQGTVYGGIGGSSDGTFFGLSDGDGNPSYSAVKDLRTDFYINNAVVFALHPSQIDAVSKQIKNVVNPTLAQDAATKNYVDSAVATAGAGVYLPLAGGTMAGNVSMGTSYRITNMANPSAAQDAATKNYVDSAVGSAGVGTFLPLAGGTMAGDITMATNQINFGTSVGDKIYWYSNTYGTGIEANTLTDWSGSQFRWRVGGTDVATGAEEMLLTGSALTVQGNINAAGHLLSTARTLYLGSQYFYGDNSSAMYINANHSTTTNLIFRDIENTVYGRVTGSGDGVNFGLMDGDSNWSILHVKDSHTAFYINNVAEMTLNSTTLDLEGNKIVDLGTPTAGTDAATKAYVDTAVSGAGGDNLGNHTATADISMGANQLSYSTGAGDKVYWHGNTLGTAVDSGNTLSNWAASGHRWRIGGTGAGTGVEYMLLSGNTLWLPYSEVRSQLGPAGSQFRAVAGNYGFMIRNDGTGTYFLLTASGDSGGSWNALRPLNISNATGNVELANTIYAMHNGDVGIGDASPSYKLDVNGAARTTNNLFVNAGRVYLGASGAQNLYGDNSSAIYSISNHSTLTQMVFRDLEGTTYGNVYGAGDGADFGLLDGDGNYVFRSNKDTYLSLIINNNEKMRLLANGNVGIGNGSPSYTLDVNGTIRAGTYLYTSDRRLKDNIETISGLDLVTKLRGVTYTWKESGKEAAGVIAQEVEEVLPRAVRTDDTGTKSVDYNQLIAPLIEAVKELKAENDSLRQRIETLEQAAAGQP